MPCFELQGQDGIWRRVLGTLQPPQALPLTEQFPALIAEATSLASGGAAAASVTTRTEAAGPAAPAPPHTGAFSVVLTPPGAVDLTTGVPEPSAPLDVGPPTGIRYSYADAPAESLGECNLYGPPGADLSGNLPAQPFIQAG